MTRARVRVIGKLAAILGEFRIVEIAILGVIAAVVLAVAVHGYWGLGPRISMRWATSCFPL